MKIGYADLIDRNSEKRKMHAMFASYISISDRSHKLKYLKR